VPQHLIHCGSQGHLFWRKASILSRQLHGVAALEREMIFELVLLGSALEPSGEEGCGVGRHLGSEEIQGHRVPEVQVLLQRWQIDSAELAWIAMLGFPAQFRGALNHPPDSRLADEHVMRLFGEHEAGGSRERVKSRFGESQELIL